MIHVFNVFSNTQRAQKPFYTTNFRQSLDNWVHQDIYSACLIKDEKLLTLQSNKENIVVDKSAGFVVLHQKINGVLEDTQLFPKNQHTLDLDILKIMCLKEHRFELHVKSTESLNLIEIPSPKRIGHKVANLDLREPVRYKTNYKFEGSGSRTAQRNYVEFDLIVVYSGIINSVEFGLKKPVLFELNRLKTIDERKILK